MSVTEVPHDAYPGVLGLSVDQRSHLALMRLNQTARLGRFPQFGPRGRAALDTILASLNLTTDDLEAYVRGWGDTPQV